MMWQDHLHLWRWWGKGQGWWVTVSVAIWVAAAWGLHMDSQGGHLMQVA